MHRIRSNFMWFGLQFKQYSTNSRNGMYESLPNYLKTPRKLTNRDGKPRPNNNHGIATSLVSLLRDVVTFEFTTPVIVSSHLRQRDSSR